jgi:hypothetical protein
VYRLREPPSIQARAHHARRGGTDLVEQLLADRAVDHGTHVRDVAEDERHVEHVDIGHHRANRSERRAQHLDRADLGLLDHGLLIAEHAAWKELELDAAVGGGIDLLAHALDCGHGGITGGVHIGSLDDGLRANQSRTRKGSGGHGK